MDTDSFANIIRSSKPHSVSVSERSGNATTTKNIVSSDADEDKPKKTAYEKRQHKDNVIGAASGDKEGNIQILDKDTKIPKSNGDFQDLVNPHSMSNIVIDPIKAQTQDVSIKNDIKSNVQGVNNNSIVNRNVNIENSDIPTNLQKLAADNLDNNSQSVSTKKSSINNQGIDDLKNSSNLQPLNGDNSDPNIQNIPKNSISNNNQPIFDLAISVNNESISNLSLKDNKQDLSNTPLANNRQPVIEQDNSLNIQGLPEDDQVGINRQTIDSSNLNDHLEILPSDKVIRDKVDFGSTTKNISKSTQQTSSSKSVKENLTVSTTTDSSPKQPQLSAQQAAKLKRDKLNEDFQGRVAAIRRNVKALNGKLDSFEPHV